LNPIPITSSAVIVGLDPAIYLHARKMDPRVTPQEVDRLRRTAPKGALVAPTGFGAGAIDANATIAQKLKMGYQSELAGEGRNFRNERP
jgi:hypothetical protein